jgi:hypothetical protein
MDGTTPETTIVIIGGRSKGSRVGGKEEDIKDLEIRSKHFQGLVNSLIEKKGREEEDWSQKFRNQRGQRKKIEEKDYEEILESLGFNLKYLPKDKDKRDDMIFILYHILSIASNLRALRDEGRGKTALYYAKMTKECNDLAALSLDLNSEELAKLFKIVRTTLQIND